MKSNTKQMGALSDKSSYDYSSIEIANKKYDSKMTDDNDACDSNFELDNRQIILKYRWGGLLEVLLELEGAEEVIKDQSDLRTYRDTLYKLEQTKTIKEAKKVINTFSEHERNYLNSPLLDGLYKQLNHKGALVIARNDETVDSINFLLERGAFINNGNFSVYHLNNTEIGDDGSLKLQCPNDKPILLVVYSDRCGHCRKFKCIFEQVNNVKLVGAHLTPSSEDNTKVWISILNKIYPLKYVPTILGFNKNGRLKMIYKSDRQLESLQKFADSL